MLIKIQVFLILKVNTKSIPKLAIGEIWVFGRVQDSRRAEEKQREAERKQTREEEGRQF